jgi:hypothetical protein
MPLSAAASWKSYFHTRKDLDASNLVLSKIKDAVSHSIPFIDSFETISKNEGIAFISLGPSESELQLFHHGVVLGGSWANPEKQLVTILASDNDSKPVQILPKFIKDFKCKTNSPDEFITSQANTDDFSNLKNPRSELAYKNIIPIPNLLTKAFLDLPKKDPISVAMTFLETMLTYDTVIDNEMDNQEITSNSGEPDIEDKSTPSNITTTNTSTKQ